MAAFLYRYALVDLLRPRRIAVWILVAAALGMLTLLFVRLDVVSGPRENYALLSSLFVFHVLPLAAAIFSSAVVSQEIEQKTIVYLLTRPVRRSTLLLARSLAAITATALAGILCALGVGLAAYGPSVLGSDLFYRDVEAICVGSAAYGSLFVLVSLLINRSMMICLLYAFAWETSVPFIPGDTYKLAITSHLSAISQRPASSDQGLLGALSGGLNENLLTPAISWPVLLILIAVCTVFGAFWFTKFEYVGREDTE